VWEGREKCLGAQVTKKKIKEKIKSEKGLRKRNGWFIATFLPRVDVAMKQHLFRFKEQAPTLFDSMIEIMLMYPLEYGLEALIQQGNGETLTESDFFANYRIFKVASTHSACYRHAEIPRNECGTAPMQDILIAHIDEPMCEGNSELLMQYQVSTKKTAYIAPGASLGDSESQLDCMSQILRTWRASSSRGR